MRFSRVLVMAAALVLAPVAVLSSFLGTFNPASVQFKFYDKTGNISYTSTTTNDDLTTKCPKSGPVTLIVHGAEESCSQLWIVHLVRALNTRPELGATGGCIICMDYSQYSMLFYPILYSYFNDLCSVLGQKVKQLLSQGIDPDKVYGVGFSFGVELWGCAGVKQTSPQIARIDMIEPVNEGLDLAGQFLQSRWQAAKKVECVHTSNDYGTAVIDMCHADWLLGTCGRDQACKSDKPYGNHGIAPYMYTMASLGNRYVSEEIVGCNLTSSRVSPWYFGTAYMGYKPLVAFREGIFGAPTYRCAPYNNRTLTCDSTLPTTYLN